MGKLEIRNEENALELVELSVMEQAAAMKKGDYKTANKYFEREMKCIVYLYNNQRLEAMEKFLVSNNVNLRAVAAYALLPVFPHKCELILSEIADGNYGIDSFNAEMTLKEWKGGKLIFPYQSGFHWAK